MIKNDRIPKSVGYLDLISKKRNVYIMLGLIIVFIFCSASATAIDGGEELEKGDFDAIGIVSSDECDCCTGTLIQGNVVLTAAHCFDLGCFDGSFDIPKAKFAVDGHSFVGKVKRYRNYVLDSGDPNNDLALIILNEDVSERLGIKPIPIAKMSGSKPLKIVGFGSISRDCKKSSLGTKYKRTFCLCPGLDYPAKRTVKPCDRERTKGIYDRDSGAPALNTYNRIVAINHGVDPDPNSAKAILKEINKNEYDWIQSEMKLARST